MNNVSLVGRLTKDPEIRYTQANNTAVGGFTLAVNRRVKQDNGPEADFISIVVWQKTAEFVSKYFKKGQQVWVHGRIQTRNWDDTDGKKHYVTEVVAEEVGFAEGKKDGGSDQGESPAQHQHDSKPAANNRPPMNPPPAGIAYAGFTPPWEMGG